LDTVRRSLPSSTFSRVDHSPRTGAKNESYANHDESVPTMEVQVARSPALEAWSAAPRTLHHSLGHVEARTKPPRHPKTKFAVGFEYELRLVLKTAMSRVRGSPSRAPSPETLVDGRPSTLGAGEAEADLEGG